jgi:hypothetical protein
LKHKLDDRLLVFVIFEIFFRKSNTFLCTD